MAMTLAVGKSVEPDLTAMYRDMVLIRAFEEAVRDLVTQSRVTGTPRLALGQEAVAVGVAAAMRPNDYSTAMYRGYRHDLARGIDPERALAEILGRAGGVNRGQNGFQHLTDEHRGLVGAFAATGVGLPVAVGLGRAAQLDGTGQVSVTFFASGAAGTGAFHEAMNLAAVWRAPVVFVCENNSPAEYGPLQRTTPVEDVAIRAAAYAMRARIVDGSDVCALYRAAGAAIGLARSGEGPSFLECKTYRQQEHGPGDLDASFPDRVETRLPRDPLARTRRELLDEVRATEEEIAQIEADVRAQIDAAVERAGSWPWPEPGEGRVHA